MASERKNVLEIIGIVCIVIVAFYILRWILRLLYSNCIARIGAIDLSKTGKWAVVTGATDGIGKAYAEALAKKKLNIVLISRTQAKLDDVASSLQKNYKVETKTIAADFTSTEIYENIDKQLNGLDIGVLINNVGLYVPYKDFFLNFKNKDKLYDDTIKCNIFSVTNMCKIVLPGMVQRKRGVIVNISSIAALIPNPLVTVYAASKAYVVKFSDDLSTEYRKDGITIQCLCPAYVATKMTGKSSSTMAPFPDKLVKSAITTIGVKDKTTGYFPHTFLLGFINFLDSVSHRLSTWLILREMTKERSKALETQTP